MCERLDAEIDKIGTVRAVVEDNIKAQDSDTALDGLVTIDFQLGDKTYHGTFDKTTADSLAEQLGNLRRLTITAEPKGRKKLIEDNIANHLLSFFKSDDGQSTSFLPDWGAIRDLPLDVRSTLTDTIESICKTIRHDIKEDLQRPRTRQCPDPFVGM